MRCTFVSVVLVLLILSSNQALSQGTRATIDPVPSSDEVVVTIATTDAGPNDKIMLLSSKAAATCTSGTPVPLQVPLKNFVGAKENASLAVKKGSLKAGNYLCAVIKNEAGGIVATSPAVHVTKPGGAAPPLAAAADKGSTDDCRGLNHYGDCELEYRLLGGIEQSDLSAQSSVTEGFYDLFINAPLAPKGSSLWFRSRYLGAPSSSFKGNIVAAATNPTGTLTAANLPQSVTAVDYVVGYQFLDWDVGPLLFVPGKSTSRFVPGKVTLSPVIGIGATTPVSATTTVSGFKVPSYGTNECDQLHLRFTPANGYNPALPGPGAIDKSGNIGCIVQPNPGSTSAKPLPGNSITAIAFSNEDRTSFLEKWGAGLRFKYRFNPSESDESTHCDLSPGCTNVMVDFSVGQDEAITGGMLRNFVLKADAIIPILTTGVSFFASSSNRLEQSKTFSPLILTPITIQNASSSGCTATATTACVPSSSVFVLPYKQQNRDYYRIGLGIDAMKILTKLFPKATK